MSTTSDSDAGDLIAEIEATAKRFGVSPGYVGKVAACDGKFYGRLKRGSRCWPETAARARERLAEWVREREARDAAPSDERAA
jgi:hypothetical protein